MVSWASVMLTNKIRRNGEPSALLSCDVNALKSDDEPETKAQPDFAALMWRPVFFKHDSKNAKVLALSY